MVPVSQQWKTGIRTNEQSADTTSCALFSHICTATIILPGPGKVIVAEHTSTECISREGKLASAGQTNEDRRSGAPAEVGFTSASSGIPVRQAGDATDSRKRSVCVLAVSLTSATCAYSRRTKKVTRGRAIRNDAESPKTLPSVYRLNRRKSSRSRSPHCSRKALSFGCACSSLREVKALLVSPMPYRTSSCRRLNAND